MEGQLNIDRRGTLSTYKPRKSSLAFIVEILVLLLFLIGSLAVIIQLLTLSASRASESKHLEQAVVVAANTAERFSADPTSVAENTTVGELSVNCKVEETKFTYGTQYDAIITVYDNDGEVYRLKTSRYAPTTFEMVTQRLSENTVPSTTEPGRSTSTPGTSNSRSTSTSSSASSSSATGAVTGVIK